MEEKVPAGHRQENNVGNKHPEKTKESKHELVGRMIPKICPKTALSVLHLFMHACV